MKKILLVIIGMLVLTLASPTLRAKATNYIDAIINTHDSAVTTDVIQLGTEARQTLGTAVADGDITRVMSDDYGRLVTVSDAPRDLHSKVGMRVTSSTTTTSVISAVASTFNDITEFAIMNRSSASVLVEVFDGTATTTIPLAPKQHSNVISINQTAVNNDWELLLTTADGEVGDVWLYAKYVANK